MNYNINEIYSCIQGEGGSVGKPSIIVRFQGCNLRCSWCDSKYSVDDRGGETLELQAVVEKIKALKIKNIIFTGGEPCLQDFSQISAYLGDDYSFEVETNAIILPHEKFADFVVDDYYKYQWNLSPKGKNAGYKFNNDQLRFWVMLAESHPRVFFKFVISKNKQNENINEVLDCAKSLKISNDRIYLMPEGNTFESQVYNEWLVDLCKKHNMNYCARLHLLLHKKTKGV